MYLNQRKLLYLPGENNYLDDPIEFQFNEINIEVDKNLKLKSWLIEKDLKNKKTLVFFMVMQVTFQTEFISLTNLIS